MKNIEEKILLFAAIAGFLVFGGIELFRLLRFYVFGDDWVDKAAGVMLAAEVALCVLMIASMKIVKSVPYVLEAIWITAYIVGIVPRLNVTEMGLPFLIVQMTVLGLICLLMLYDVLIDNPSLDNVDRWLFLLAVVLQVVCTVYFLLHPKQHMNRRLTLISSAYIFAILAWIVATAKAFRPYFKHHFWLVLISAVSFVCVPVGSSTGQLSENGQVLFAMYYVYYGILAFAIVMYSLWLRRTLPWGDKVRNEAIKVEGEEIVVVDDSE